MKRFHFLSKTRRVVLDTVSLSVDAENLNEAKANAIKVLEDYPKGNTYVPYCYVENRETLESQVVSMRRLVPTNDKAA